MAVPGTRASPALGVLEREHRFFDVARIRLWRAEDGTPIRPGLEAALATFEELGAHPHLSGPIGSTPARLDRDDGPRALVSGAEASLGRAGELFAKGICRWWALYQ